MKPLINKYLNETYDGQKDLEAYTSSILMLIAKEALEEYHEDGEIEFWATNTKEIDDHPEYREIGDFVKQVKIKITPKKYLENDDRGQKGQFKYGRVSDNSSWEYYEIILRYDTKLNRKIESNLKKYPHTDVRSVYATIYYDLYTTLLHELQHAYDAWRSKGKNSGGQFNSTYLNKQNKARQLREKGLHNLTDEEIEVIKKGFFAYQNLVHEINARYAQTMHKVRVLIGDEDWNEIPRPWADVLSDFKRGFDGWSNMSDKMQKKMIKRLIKSYDQACEEAKTAVELYGPEQAEELVGIGK